MYIQLEMYYLCQHSPYHLNRINNSLMTHTDIVLVTISVSTTQVQGNLDWW